MECSKHLVYLFIYSHAYRVRFHIIYARLNLVKLQEALDDADDIQF